MPYTELEGLPLFYERRGPEDSGGPLVIFFNGWCLSGRYWGEAVVRLEGAHSLLVFDGRGFGRSLPGRGPLPVSCRATIEAEVAEAWTLLAKLGLATRSYQVVGHSLGGVTAALFAAQAEAKGQLAGLTIVNSGSFEENEAQGSQLNTFVKIFVKVKRAFDLPLVRRAVVARSVARPIPARYARIITEDFALADGRMALELSLSSLEVATLRQYRACLEGLAAPLLLIVGDRDATIPPKGMYNIGRFKPAARLVSFADCGHLPMLEDPDRFAGVLARFWRSEYGD